MSHALDAASLDQLFRTARTYNAFTGEVSDDTLRQLYDLLKFGPTQANTTPARFVFVKSAEAKAKLADCVMEGNRAKVLAAPVTAVIGYDIDFHEELPWLFPHTDAKSWFEGDEEGRKEGAFRNSSLQGAYLMLAARAIGLDCGPMSGVNLDKVTEEFFAEDPKVRADWICSIGYGDASTIFDRSPRPDFAKFNTVV